SIDEILAALGFSRFTATGRLKPNAAKISNRDWWETCHVGRKGLRYGYPTTVYSLCIPMEACYHGTAHLCSSHPRRTLPGVSHLLHALGHPPVARPNRPNHPLLLAAIHAADRALVPDRPTPECRPHRRCRAEPPAQWRRRCARSG